MNSISLIICYVISLYLPASSMCKGVKQIKPKLCIDCKYFIPDDGNGIFGKCSLFQKKEGNINFLVNVINDEKYYYCTTSRDSKDMCGEEGKYYKKKIFRKSI